jgi:hypothetical protein
MNQAINESPRTLSSTAIAVRYGLMTSFVLMFITTLNYLYALSYSHGLYVIGNFFIIVVIPCFFYFLTAQKQKKALGNQATLKEIFKSVFVVIIISVIVTTLYNQIYFKNIDPDFFNRLKVSLEEVLVKRGADQKIIDDKIGQLNQMIQNKPSTSDYFFDIAQSIVMRSIVGLLISFVIKKISIFKS